MKLHIYNVVSTGAQRCATNKHIATLHTMSSTSIYRHGQQEDLMQLQLCDTSNTKWVYGDGASMTNHLLSDGGERLINLEVLRGRHRLEVLQSSLRRLLAEGGSQESLMSSRRDTVIEGLGCSESRGLVREEEGGMTISILQKLEKVVGGAWRMSIIGG